MSKITENYTNFIGMYENIFADGFCENLIESFDLAESNGLVHNRKKSENVNKIIKEDSYFFINLFNHRCCLRDYNDQFSFEILSQGLKDCFDRYCEKYDILNDQFLMCDSFKMQKTDPGAGYHVWHAEQAGGEQKSRCLVFSIYLNTIEDAGETEFLYQKLRISPKKNTCAIWPASFTHTHRGNVVHGDKSKYIVTGWFYLN